MWSPRTALHQARFSSWASRPTAICVLWCVFYVILTISAQPTQGARTPRNGQLLYVWAGEASGTAEDIIAIYDFSEGSSRFSKLQRVVKLKGKSNSGNEPHHCGFSADKKTFGSGGLLSLLKGQDELFWFDSGSTYQDALSPRQLLVNEGAANPPLSAVADEYIALKNGGFAITMMGRGDGMCPGKVAEISPDLELVGEYPLEDPPKAECFCPHGIAIDENRGVAITGDFVVPASILPGQPGPTICNTFRIWDWNSRTITRTVEVPFAQGFMNTLLIPNDPNGRAYIVPMVNGTLQLFLLNMNDGSYEPVLDLPSSVPSFTFLRFTKNGKRLFIAADKAGELFVVDTSSPKHPKLIKKFSIPNSGLHYTRLDRDEKYVLVSGYFLNAGKVVDDGDHKVHIFRNGHTVTQLGSIDLTTAVPGHDYRPHGFDFWWKV